jgi:hypothetical protein
MRHRHRVQFVHQLGGETRFTMLLGALLGRSTTRHPFALRQAVWRHRFEMRQRDRPLAGVLIEMRRCAVSNDDEGIGGKHGKVL